MHLFVFILYDLYVSRWREGDGEWLKQGGEERDWVVLVWWRHCVIFPGFCHPAQPSVFVTLHTLIQPAALAFISQLITVRASAHTSGSWQEALHSASLPLCPCFSYSAPLIFHGTVLPFSSKSSHFSHFSSSCVLSSSPSPFLCHHPSVHLSCLLSVSSLCPSFAIFSHLFSLSLSLFAATWLLICLLSSSLQALQALQRQPNAAQYFQQLMLQQQINNAQLQNLAAVQQVKVCVGYIIYIFAEKYLQYCAKSFL